MAFNIGTCPGAAKAGAGFPQWTVITAPGGITTGVVGKVSNAAVKGLVEATAFPNRVYFFTSQAAAQNCVNASGGAVSPAVQKALSAGQDTLNTATGGTAAPGAACAWMFPGVAGFGSFCLITKTEVRAGLAGLIIGASGIVTLVGVALLTVQALQATGAAHAAGGALETVGAGVAFVPGGQGAGLALGAAGAGARRAGSSSGARQSLDRRRTARTQRAAAKTSTSTGTSTRPGRPGP